MRYRFRFIIEDEDIAEFETDATPPSIGDEVVIGPNLIAAGGSLESQYICGQ